MRHFVNKIFTCSQESMKESKRTVEVFVAVNSLMFLARRDVGVLCKLRTVTEGSSSVCEAAVIEL